MRISTSALLTLAVLAGSESPIMAQAVQGRDSAGIRIFDYTEVLQPKVAFRISPLAEPILVSRPDVGVSLGASASYIRLSDGRSAVPTVGTRTVAPNVTERLAEIRLFDADGTLRTVAGGVGSGPGQFSSPISIFALMPGDTMIAGTSSGFVNVFDPQGKLIRSFRVTANAHLVTLIGVLGDHSLLAEQPESNPPPRMLPTPGTPLPPGSQRVTAEPAVPRAMPTRYYRFSTTGALLGEVKGPVGELLVMSMNVSAALTPGDRADPAELARQMRPAVPESPWPLRMSPSAGGKGNTIWNVREVEWQINIYDGKGVPRGIVRLPKPSSLRDAKFGAPFPLSQQVALRTFIDEVGRFWIDAPRDQALLESAERTWWVLEPDGAMIGSVVAPANFSLFRADSTYVTGLLRRPNEAISIVRFPLQAVR